MHEQKSLNKKSPREGIASDTKFSIFHIILNIFLILWIEWGQFEWSITRKKLLKASVKNMRTLPALSSRNRYVQWKANVKTFAKVKNWALPFLHEAKRSGNEGKLEDYVLGLHKLLSLWTFLSSRKIFLALYDYVRLMLAGNDGAMLLMLLTDASLFCGFFWEREENFTELTRIMWRALETRKWLENLLKWWMEIPLRKFNSMHWILWTNSNH